MNKYVPKPSCTIYSIMSITILTIYNTWMCVTLGDMWEAVILLENWTVLDMYKWSCATGKKNVWFMQRG
jgi:hypothetical protein